MCVGEADALVGEGVDVGGVDFGLVVVAAYVAVAEVVGEYEYDVGEGAFFGFG